MLQETYDRIAPIVEPDQVYVVTAQRFAPFVWEQLPDIPPRNVLIEPAGRGTAPCIGLAALHIQRRDPGAVMAVLPADHVIRKVSAFHRALETAKCIAEQGYLVTFGIQPDRPHTGYGYIQLGNPLVAQGVYTAYAAARFTEKPDQATAEGFLAAGNYLWNSGMFVWRVNDILAEIARLLPDLYQRLMQVAEALDTPQAHEVLCAQWGDMPNITVDYGVMEKASRVAVIPVDLGWSDVGDWSALAEILDQDEHGNVLTGVQEQFVGLDTKNSLIHSSGRLVATIGLTDMVVIDAEDAVLICPRDRAQDVKLLVEELENRKRRNRRGEHD